MSMELKESLQKIEHDLDFMRDDLRSALGSANSVESLAIIAFIRRVSELRNDVVSFRSAYLLDHQ